MAKIKIDLNPTGPITFERVVEIPTPSGKPVKLPLTFKHRTREQMAALMDTYRQRAKETVEEPAASEDSEEATADYLASVRRAMDSDVEAIMDVVVGWGIDGAEFTHENVLKFISLYPGAALAIISDYRVGMTQGRLGN